MKFLNKRKLLVLILLISLISQMQVYAKESTKKLVQDEIITSLEDMQATMIDCKYLKVYKKPDYSSKIIENIPYGKTFTVHDQVGKWFSITYEDISGYVFWNYVSFVEENISKTSSLIGNSIIHYTSSENRDNNINIACKTINGIVLKPNDEFKWSNIVGQTTLKKGYLKAPIIVNKKTSYGLGGGVCQVSTALYNALLDTKITPSEIHHHSIGSAYSENDAAVAYGSKDFVFRNIYNFPIEIEAYSYKSVVCVNIYKFD